LGCRCHKVLSSSVKKKKKKKKRDVSGEGRGKRDNGYMDGGGEKPLGSPSDLQKTEKTNSVRDSGGSLKKAGGRT